MTSKARKKKLLGWMIHEEEKEEADAVAQNPANPANPAVANPTVSSAATFKN